MKKVFFLKTCNTCRRIMQPLDLTGWDVQEISSQPVTEHELKDLHRLSGSYEALFNKRSMQIRERGLDVKSLSESDFKKLLLEHYSFLKRPVFVDGNHIFIGNERANLEKLNAFLHVK